MRQVQWPSGPADPQLATDAVDVWLADLAAARERDRGLLSADEQARARRFARAEDGRRWAAAHEILRELLGACLGADPRSLAFAEGPYGKPRLADGGALRFNLSHSGDVALYALALGREVGVDVELPRPRADHVALARRIGGDVAARQLAELAPADREREFLRLWVRWEAALKCRGTGIGGADAAPGGSDPWLHELDAGAPAAAALAVEGGPCAVRCWRWPAVGA
jgi:4'-phosphopantetheinyl transferase